MGRVRVFAAPFVVTAALGGCTKEGRDEPAPRPEPKVQVDAAVAVNPPAPPDAAVLPEATKDQLVYVQAGKCRVGDYAEVKCPVEGAPLSIGAQSIADGDAQISLRTSSMTCFRDEPFECPEAPPGTAVSNPPAPTPVECPEDLLPVLRVDLEPEQRDGKCWYRDIQVWCRPPEPPLPAAPKGALVYELGGECFVDRGGSPGEVACPKGGAPLVLGSSAVGDQYLREPDLICFQRSSYQCPDPGPGKGASCNPPPPRQVECDDALMPRLRDGVEPEQRDGKCSYRGVQVRCP